MNVKINEPQVTNSNLGKKRLFCLTYCTLMSTSECVETENVYYVLCPKNKMALRIVTCNVRGLGEQIKRKKFISFCNV